MKVFNDILVEVMAEEIFDNWYENCQEAAKRYATQVTQNALDRAAENAGSLRSVSQHVRKIITDTKIVLP